MSSLLSHFSNWGLSYRPLGAYIAWGKPGWNSVHFKFDIAFLNSECISCTYNYCDGYKHCVMCESMCGRTECIIILFHIIIIVSCHDVPVPVVYHLQTNESPSFPGEQDCGGKDSCSP